MSSPSAVLPAVPSQLPHVTARPVPDPMPTHAHEEVAAQHVDKKQRKSRKKDAAGDQSVEAGLMDMSV